MIHLPLAIVFSFCPTQTIYDRPDGIPVVVEGRPNISTSAVFREKSRNPNRVDGWMEVMLTGRGDDPIDNRTYWVRPEETCGIVLGR